MSQITELLGIGWSDGGDAFESVVRMLYGDLGDLTVAEMHRRFGGRIEFLTREPMELLHDAMARLMRERAEARNRQEFFAITARLIGEVIVEYQRQRLALKRGGRKGRGESLDTSDGPVVETPSTDEAVLAKFQKHLGDLARVNPLAAEVVTLRMFPQMRRAQVIELTGASASAIDRAWREGRDWLESAMGLRPNENL